MFGQIFIIPLVLRTRGIKNYFAKHACDFSLILLDPCNFLYKLTDYQVDVATVKETVRR